jgi:NADPH-dependent 2,4-dienoyl-CoA reductase/sulfur reductase-like enzyme/rhodanese-related sulfurtransferase
MLSGPKIVIVGGVAGGASCAARARRLSEKARIVLFERGPFVSFANCGLPYFVGRVIKRQDDLLLADPDFFRERFAIDVRVGHEVIKIERDKKAVLVRDLASGATSLETYDFLVLAPGAAPKRPDIPGADMDGIFVLRNIPDSLAIMEWMGKSKATRAVVAGGGFIGMEMVENLVKRGLEVTVVEMERQLMPGMDPEMTALLLDELASGKVAVKTGQKVAGFGQSKGSLEVFLSNSEKIATEMVVLALGVKPETDLAQQAGLAIGNLGGIAANGRMQTSDPAIFAVGDAVEKTSLVTGLPALIPLAGPANRQGRMVADIILGSGQEAPSFGGVLGTFVCGVFGLTLAGAGESEKSLARAARQGKVLEYEKIYAQGGHHSGYYPGAQTLVLKLIFEKKSGKILGVQAAGRKGVEKRVDAVATAMRAGATVRDLAQAELCYAPQYGSAKDPVNVAAMVACNVLDNLMPVAHWENLSKTDALILDVREPSEVKRGMVPGALHIPLHDLRKNFDALPRDREIWVYCHMGQRSYFANRLLNENGFNSKNLSGGWAMYNFVRRVA